VEQAAAYIEGDEEDVDVEFLACVTVMYNGTETGDK
jgi:hypothetical protein